eukprot:17837-Heterococcus_DN1.PRE.1
MQLLVPCTAYTCVCCTITDESLAKTEALRRKLQHVEHHKEVQAAVQQGATATTLSLIQLMTYVLFDTLARGRDRSTMHTWCEYLAAQYCQSQEARDWLLQQVRLTSSTCCSGTTSLLQRHHIIASIAAAPSEKGLYCISTVEQQPPIQWQQQQQQQQQQRGPSHSAKIASFIAAALATAKLTKASTAADTTAAATTSAATGSTAADASADSKGDTPSAAVAWGQRSDEQGVEESKGNYMDDDDETVNTVTATDVTAAVGPQMPVEPQAIAAAPVAAETAVAAEADTVADRKPEISDTGGSASHESAAPAAAAAVPTAEDLASATVAAAAAYGTVAGDDYVYSSDDEGYAKSECASDSSTGNTEPDDFGHTFDKSLSTVTVKNQHLSWDEAQAMEMSLSSSATAAAAAAQGQLDKATAHLWEQRREFRADLAKAKRLEMTPPDEHDDHPEVSSLNFKLKPSIITLKVDICMIYKH